MHGATLLSRMASFALVSTVLLPVLPSPPTIQRLPSKSGLKPEPANPFGDIWSMNPGVQVTTSGDSSPVQSLQFEAMALHLFEKMEDYKAGTLHRSPLRFCALLSNSEHLL
jgi:hypothetical protein